MTQLKNLRVARMQPLLPPAILMEELPLSASAAETVAAGREAVASALSGNSDRFIVVCGPCSIHDPKAAMEYAEKLKASASRFADELLVVMRVYFEKPRTTVGWKGLINDPNLDGTFRINDGLRKARGLLRDIAELGLPAATEFLDLITPQFYSELISWGAIGARTTESQTHRELASGLSMPIGFKNGTSGDVQIAVDAVKSSSMPHRFVGVSEQGLAGIVHTTGNPHCHVILRGGSAGPNYDTDSIARAASAMEKAKVPARIMVDASHGNSSKDFRRQPQVIDSLAEQLEAGTRVLVGTMMESHLVEGNQALNDPKDLVYGQSVTDACMSWETTAPLLERLAKAVQKRRELRAAG
jgi:3-deoxy-7-phosphoheptulonate synthase